MTSRKLTTEEREYITLLEDTRRLASLPQGRKFIWHVLSLCELHSSSFTGNSRTFYNEGKRDVGLGVLQLLEEADPTIYPSLIMERAKKQMAQNQIGENENG